MYGCTTKTLTALILNIVFVLLWNIYLICVKTTIVAAIQM